MQISRQTDKTVLLRSLTITRKQLSIRLLTLSNRTLGQYTFSYKAGAAPVRPFYIGAYTTITVPSRRLSFVWLCPG
jgi:hypothetical protein